MADLMFDLMIDRIQDIHRPREHPLQSSNDFVPFLHDESPALYRM